MKTLWQRFTKWLFILFHPPVRVDIPDPFPQSSPTDGSPHYRRLENPPGSKVARAMMKVRGLPYRGEVYHTEELTKANNERAAARRARADQTK